MEGLGDVVFNGSQVESLERGILKISDEIEPNSDAIYGFSLRAESPLSKFEIDFTDKESVKKARDARRPYLENLRKKKEALVVEIKELKEKGYSLEDIGRIKVEWMHI